MTFEFHVAGPSLAQERHIEPILRALPEWFGIESALQRYVNDVASMPTFVARLGTTSNDGAVVGFVTVRTHFEQSAEVHVAGVLPKYHRRGIGRELLYRAEDWLRTRQVEYLQVKTLGESSRDPFYAETRAFYMALGFVPLEELKTLWDEQNPCLILVKRL